MHIVAGVSASPQVTAHSELSVQVTLQSPSHLTVHAVEPEHAAVLAAPSWSLQLALVEQAADEAPPSLKSQVELSVHVTALAAPPIPLHSDESAHVTTSESSEVPLHFAELEQLSAHAESPHSVLQSAPATQTHESSAHEHPVPVHVGAGSEPPQPTSKHNATSHSRMEASRSAAYVTANVAGETSRYATRRSRCYDGTCMRWLLLCGLALGCAPPPPDPQYSAAYAPPPQLAAASHDPTQVGTVVDRTSGFAFDGGRLEFEMRLDGTRVIQIARSYYAVPIMMQWNLGELDNLSQAGPLSGVVALPPAAQPNSPGPAVVLTTMHVDDPRRAYHREMQFQARFGDPRARPEPYAYRLPFRAGKTFSVLQGFHGAFSHRGSNEFAVDFDCPVATPVLAARPGLVVAAHAGAQGSGTTPDFLEYKRTNFVIVLHDDGTLGEYMHLSPSGVRVAVGQRVERGDELALSGNSGFSSTPHLHFQVMTAANDGVSAQSFPFQFAVSAKRVETPVQGRAYPSWE